MRSDIVSGAVFPDYELKWDAGDLSPFHGWNKRGRQKAVPG